MSCHRITNALVFGPETGFLKRDVFVKDGLFVGRQELPADLSQLETIDGQGAYLIPGLIDLHLHGCLGHDFTKADEAGIATMIAYQTANGITTICPTTLTLAEDQLALACSRIASYKNDKACAAIAGIYMEGPFVAKEEAGAQNPAYIRQPDPDLFRRLQLAAQGQIKIVTLAPEIEGALDFIEEFSGQVGCSLGHSKSGYERASQAMAAGARQVTHLYCSMLPFSRQDPGLIGAALDREDCMVELITDGVHVHPATVRGTFKMFGPDKIVLISDSTMATGLSDGDYELGGLPVVVKGNAARLKSTGGLAGSVTNLMDCLRRAVLDMGIDMHSAVKAASFNPAKALGLETEFGSLEIGRKANYILLDPLNLRILKLGLADQT